jgi:phospholipid/cholesterol/gamma-HCH transport system substrate-binding protein
MHRNTLETIMGGIVFLAAVGFLMLAYEAADLKGNDGYQIAAEFGSTGGLSVGDDVRVSGIKVGQITAQQLDPITFVAKVFMAIDPTIKIPSDSSARITQASLLGGNYLELMPGAATETLVAGSVIYDTRDPVSLNDLLGKVVFSAGSGPSSSGDVPVK